MKCPNCNVGFHPQMDYDYVGPNAKGNTVYVYYQMCPECKEPVVGVKVQDLMTPISSVEGLALLTKKS